MSTTPQGRRQQCPACKEWNDAAWQKCEFCGSDLAPSVDAAPPGELQKRCPACAELINLRARICRHCQSELVFCPQCGSETSPKLRDCPACGRPASAQIAKRPGIPVLQPIPNRPQAGANDIARGVREGIASTQSYVGPAFLALLLYYVGFYVIGLIVNIAYLSSANRIKHDTGITPTGHGCLVALIVVHFWIPLVLAVIAGGVLAVMALAHAH